MLKKDVVYARLTNGTYYEDDSGAESNQGYRAIVTLPKTVSLSIDSTNSTDSKKYWNIN